MIKRIALFAVSMIIFLTGCMLYGIIINLREDSLSEAMAKLNLKQLKSPNIVINRKKYTLSLYEDTLLVKSYTAVFGRNHQPKKVADDKATPYGDYYICEIDSNSIYYRFFKINYPNLKDLQNALHNGAISKTEFEASRYQEDLNASPRPDSKLGGNVGIHGIGRLNFLFKNLPFVFNWTDGSIAISNESINELAPIIQKGTKVTIND